MYNFLIKIMMGNGDKKANRVFQRQKDAKPWIDSVVEELEKIIKVSAEFQGITFGEFKEIFNADKKENLHITPKLATNRHMQSLNHLMVYPSLI